MKVHLTNKLRPILEKLATRLAQIQSTISIIFNLSLTNILSLKTHRFIFLMMIFGTSKVLTIKLFKKMKLFSGPRRTTSIIWFSGLYFCFNFNNFEYYIDYVDLGRILYLYDQSCLWFYVYIFGLFGLWLLFSEITLQVYSDTYYSSTSNSITSYRSLSQRLEVCICNLDEDCGHQNTDQTDDLIWNLAWCSK